MSNKSYYLEQAKEIMDRMRHRALAHTYISEMQSFSFTAGEGTKEEAKEAIAETIQQPAIVEAIPANTPEPEAFYKTLTSFSGADLVISCGTEICGEVAALDYSVASSTIKSFISEFSDYYDRTLVKDYPVTLVIEESVFSKNINIPDGSNITLSYANEYGHASKQAVYDVKKLFRFGGISVDTVVKTEYYILCAKEVTPLEVIK